MKERSDKSLARKIYLELLARENLDVIDGPRTQALVEKAWQFAAAFREGSREAELEAQDPKRGRRQQEGFAVRQEQRRVASREGSPSGRYLHRPVPLADLKAANEPRQASKPTLKPIQPQPLE